MQKVTREKGSTTKMTKTSRVILNRKRGNIMCCWTMEQNHER